MRKLKGLSLVFMAAISGCASINTNVAAFSDEYYRENITKSENFQKSKEYLLKNKIKLYSIVSHANSPTGALGSFVVDGESRNFTSLANTGWLKAIMNMLINSELSGIVVSENDLNIYTLTYCGDFTHATIGENGGFGKMEYTYFLSNTSEDQRKALFNAPMLSDCAIGSFLGDVIYTKKINVGSTTSSARVSFTQKDKSKPITNEDNVALILKDMADQAMAALLTDGEMLQALKDYRLNGDKTPQQPKPQ